MQRASPRWLFLALPLVVGCSELREINAGVCGNGVVEGVEDCDGKAGCGAPSSTSACRFICESDDQCKSGWRCGKDAICREPTGEFQASGAPIPLDQPTRISTGDFDGDGFDDVLSVSQSGKLGVHYFDTSGLAASSSFLSTPMLPASGRLSAPSGGSPDASDDIAHLGGYAVGVLQGSSDRGLSPVAYSPIPVPQADSRFVMMEGRSAKKGDDKDELIHGGHEILQITGKSLVSLLDKVVLSDALPIEAKNLPPSEPMFGQLDGGLTSPCDELVLMEVGASEVHIITPCIGGVWNEKLVKKYPSVALPLAGKVGRGGVLADVDGDLVLDMVIAGPDVGDDPEDPRVNELYIAYGVGDGTFHDGAGGANKATRLLSGIGKSFPGIPLAAGRINPDLKADIVFERGIALSDSCAPNPGCYGFLPIEGNRLMRAVVADINNNGFDDVAAIASSSREVFFANGTGYGALNVYRIPTEGFPSHMAVGDFDGDLVPDLVISESEQPFFDSTGPGAPDVVSSDTPRDTLSVLFGKLQGAPEAPVSMGKLGSVRGMSVGHLLFKGFDLAMDIGVLSSDATGALSVALFGGSTDRQLQSPFELTTAIDANPSVAVAVGIGRFADEDHPDLAVLSFPNPLETKPVGSPRFPASLWLLPATGDAELAASKNHLTSLEGVDIDPCTASLVRADLDGDGRDEIALLGMPHKRTDSGGRVVVARSVGGTWKLDPAIKLPDVPLTNERVARTTCRYLEVGTDGAIYVNDYIDDGTVQVANLDGKGVPDILAFSVTAKLTPPATLGEPKFRLTLFRDGAFDAPLSLQIPSELVPLGAVLINVDLDPKLELILAAYSGVFSFEVNLDTGTLDDKKAIVDYGFGAAGPAISDPKTALLLGLTGVVTGDFDGNRIPDFAIGHSNGIEMFYGKAQKP